MLFYARSKIQHGWTKFFSRRSLTCSQSCFAAERLQSPGGVRGAIVDVVVGTEFLRQFRLIGATANRRDLEPHVPRTSRPRMLSYRNY